MNMIERARALRATIEKLMENLSDTDAVESTELFPKWQEGVLYSIGTRLRYDGVLYKVIQNHTSQADWAPVDAPALFAEILPGQDGTDIGEWVQPNSTNGYNVGDRVLFEGHIYESLVANNVWPPTTPNVWQLIE